MKKRERSVYPLLNRYSWINAFHLFSAIVLFSERERAHLCAQRFMVVHWEFPLNIFPAITNPNTYLALYYLVVSAFLVLSFNPKRSLAAAPYVLSPVLWATAIALLTSFGIFFYSLHGYFLVSLGLAIAYFAKKEKLSLEFALAANVSMYVTSGLWKLRALLGANDVVEYAKIALPHQIALGVAENFSLLRISYVHTLVDHPWLSFAAWSFIIFFQIFAALSIIKFKGIWKIPFLASFVIFHVVSFQIVGPEFNKQIALLCFFGVILYLRRITTSKYPAFIQRLV